MKLLVSVVDAGEAQAAAAAPTSWTSRTWPRARSARRLRRSSPVRAAVPAELPVSAAIGDMPNLPGTGPRRARRGPQRRGVREGRAVGRLDRDEAVALLRAVRDAVAGVPGTVLVAAAYADARRVAHAPLAPELLPRVVAAAGVGVCLLDTAVKDGRGLLDWLSPDELTSLVADAHDAGLQVALAGALRAEDLPVVRATGADIVGVLGRVRRRQAFGVRGGGARPCPARGLHYAGAGVSLSPETCSRCEHMLAASSRVAAGTASPQAAAAASARTTSSSMRS